MKHVKTPGLAIVAAAVLMALAGTGTASATVLTGSGGSVLPTGTSIHAVLDSGTGPAKLTTSFKNIECSKSTVAGKTTNGTGTVVEASIETLTFEECNCEVKVLNKGTLSIAWTSGSNGTLKSNGAEVTAQCSTIFGAVHCIYVTENTDLGTLTGSTTTGATATMDIESANIPRLSTSALCAETAKWDAKYSIDSPDTLNVANEGGEEEGIPLRTTGSGSYSFFHGNEEEKGVIIEGSKDETVTITSIAIKDSLGQTVSSIDFGAGIFECITPSHVYSTTGTPCTFNLKNTPSTPSGFYNLILTTDYGNKTNKEKYISIHVT